MTSAAGGGAELHLGDYREIVRRERIVADAIIMDAPWSERTHSGQAESRSDGGKLTDINYSHWTPDDVQECVWQLGPRCRGWWVSLTDHVLVPAWERALADSGRVTFAPLPAVVRGSRPRFCGDGPACVTTQVVVARPRGEPYSKWGALPGDYRVSRGRQYRIGGKPLELMRQIVGHYTRPGDLILDPCAGGGTTLVAAVLEGRRAVGCEIDPEAHAVAMQRLDEIASDRSGLEAAHG